ncbi:ligand-binding sensor domain-containing protein [Niabella ginsengisoli]|uniref:Uncharacterized protein n=1 Tax=Niabella ginsengisoli TaxID=522298 RepID=A0ABS9SJ20_9BACT|nr:two-component regulator propeller domain-containing protein [Niabella ginsengisoli]MCH5598315.1 hypothetical protein [Niabella ginsengisoli]
MVATASKAKSQKISFNSWTTESGLSQNTVYSICEDKYGYIWIGTRNGLNRFDGKDFKLYHPPTIDKSVTGENDITALQTDKDDLLWIGMNNGLVAYDFNKHTYFQVKLDSDIYKFSTNAIYRDDASNVWLATNKGIFYSKKKSFCI